MARISPRLSARLKQITSATLPVAGTFDFMRDRLGMRGVVSARVREASLGTSFDFQRQALLTVPSDKEGTGRE